MGRERRPPWRRLRLSTQIVLLSLAIVVLTLGTGVAVSILHARDQLDKQSGEQSLAIARSVAQIPEIRTALRGAPSPTGPAQRIAERIRVANGAAFVVVANQRGIRYSHPDPEKIGEPVSTDPSEPLAGREYVGVQTGTLGKSVRAKVPIRDRGEIVGLVSVGILQSTLSARLRADLPVLLIPPGIGLLLGAIGSVLLARRIKNQTFGLEPNEIATLLEQREAVLHGIREGAVATDADGRITLLNDEAKRLLEVDDAALGRPLVDIVPSGHAREVLAGHVVDPDQVVLVNDRVLVANRMPVAVRGRTIGSVVTLRDRTELEKLMRELNDVRSLADALRAQEHEFSHRLHVVAGLIELGRYDEAVRYVRHSSLVHQALVSSIVESIGEPTIAALLLGKAAVASERGIELRITDDTRLPEDYPDATDLVTVVGNLIDNALDSVASGRRGGMVEVTIRSDAEGVLIRVRDSGPGVDPALVDEIFRDGFTTKAATGTGRRGLGLALVSQTVRRRAGGYVSVDNEGGAIFTAFLPHHAVAEVAS